MCLGEFFIFISNTLRIIMIIIIIINVIVCCVCVCKRGRGCIQQAALLLRHRIQQRNVEKLKSVYHRKYIHI